MIALDSDFRGLTVFVNLLKVHCQVRPACIFQSSNWAMLESLGVIQLIDMLLIDKSNVWSAFMNITDILMLK